MKVYCAERAVAAEPCADLAANADTSGRGVLSGAAAAARSGSRLLRVLSGLGRRRMAGQQLMRVAAIRQDEGC